MSQMSREELKKRYCELQDDALLREALIGAGELTPLGREAIAEALASRFGPYRELSGREVDRAGQLVGRLHDTRGFARLRAPGEPLLGGRDVPPYDGILFLATGGLGFLPTSAPAEQAFVDFAPAAQSGPIAAWLGPEGLAWPEGVDQGGPRPLPLPLRARLDPGAAWIDVASIDRVAPARRELRVYVREGADAVFRLPEPKPLQMLKRWAAHVERPFG